MQNGAIHRTRTIEKNSPRSSPSTIRKIKKDAQEVGDTSTRSASPCTSPVLSRSNENTRYISFNILDVTLKTFVGSMMPLLVLLNRWSDT